MDVVDARGLLCPLPVVRTQDRVRELAHGSSLKILATDPGVLEDIPAWCRIHGHHVRSVSETNNTFEIVIEINKPD